MRNIALKVAYDGGCFFGWQENKHSPSVEKTLKSILEEILQEDLYLQAASRTDRGVHAEGQIVNFKTYSEISLSKLQIGLNALLPSSIVILDIYKAPEKFHPTLHAIGKEYTYEICFGPIQLPHKRHNSWHVPYLLDLQKMKKGASYFIGEHDFSSFCNQRRDLNYEHKKRYLSHCELIVVEEKNLKIRLIGNHFLYKMVRIIVGTLVEVGRGKILPDEIPTILSSRSRCVAGMTAPAHGLVLKKVFYPQEILI